MTRLSPFILLFICWNGLASAAFAINDYLLVPGTSGDSLVLNPRALGLSEDEPLSIAIGDAVYRFTERRRDVNQQGGQLWVGERLGGHRYEEILLTQGNGVLYGRLITTDGSWVIGPESPGGPVIIRREASQFVGPANDDRIEASLPFEPPTRQDWVLGGDGVLQSGDDIIDVGIIYSQEIRDYYGPALATRLQYLVNLFDQALRESDTGLTARLAYIGEVPAAWNDQVTTPQTLDDLYAGGGFGDSGTSETATGTCILSEPCENDGDLSDVFSIRNDRALDVIVFVRRAYRLIQQGCGMAFVNGQNAGVIDPASESPRAFAVIGDGLDASGTGTECTELTLAHEIGHLMGSDHNIDAARRIGVFDYSFGFRADCEFKTIMSYDSLGSDVVCAGNNPPTAPNEARVVRFSNPELPDCMGRACGSRTSDPVTDNARSLSLAGRDVQFFRHPAAPSVRSAILPLARAVRNGEVATAFLSVINPASAGNTARQCRLVLHGAAPGVFSYQTTDPATNALTGSADTPVDIPAGGLQTFLFTLQSASSWTAGDLVISADCENRRMGDVQPGVNTFDFISTNLQIADIVAVAATVKTPGVVELPSAGGSAAFAVATTNLGALSTVNVVVRAGSQANRAAIAALEFCRTDPETGRCLTARSPSGSFLFGKHAQLTFAVFVRGQGELANRPGENRIFLDFSTPGGLRVGSTSVAVMTVSR